MLLCGKTRNGKTTGALALALQVLFQGSDGHGSGMTIIDPKRAELSMCSRHVITLDDNGEARAVLEELKAFAETMRVRQNYLNVMSKENGDALHWWDVGFKPAILFIDEYVALRSVFPKKASKDDDYRDMQTVSNELCREYGLSVLDDPRTGKAKNYGEWQAEQEQRPM